MKNSKQIAETVLKIRDSEQEKIKVRNRRIKKITAGASTMFIFCAVILAARHLNSTQVMMPPTISDNRTINTEKTTSTSDTVSSDSSNVSTVTQIEDIKGTANEKPTGNNKEIQKETSERETEVIAADSKTETTFSNDSSEVTNTEHQTEDKTNPTNAEPIPESSRDENVIIPKWDERTLPTQFMEFTFNGIIYGTRDSEIDSYYIGNPFGAVTMTGEDVYEDKTYTINAEIFNINGIASDCAVAVKFNGYENCYVYTNGNYHPNTLGELVDALNLNSNLTFGDLILSDDRTIVTDYDRQIIKDILNTYRTCENLSNSIYHKRLFSVAVSVDILGIKNKAFTITEDGYFITNIMDWQNTFYIGADKAQEIADKLGIDKIERDTTPQDYDPQEEVIYEE